MKRLNDGFYKLAEYVVNELHQETEKCNVLFFDLDRIIYFYDGIEYTIRMWNITQAGNVSFTVYKRTKNDVENIYDGFFQYKET